MISPVLRVSRPFRNHTLVLCFTGIVTVECLLLLPVAAAQASGGLPDDSRVRIVVLPFDNLSGQAADAWFGRGIADTVAAELSRSGISDIVNSATSMSSLLEPVGFEGGLATGRSVGAAFVVTGGYQRLGDRLRLTGRVTAVTTGMARASSVVDGPVDDLFALQDRLASDLVAGFQHSPDTTGSHRRREPLPVSASAEPTPGEETGAPVLLPMSVQPPVLVSPDDEGRVTIRPTKLTEAIQLDGQLDEVVYQAVPAITDFIQQKPDEGEPATEKTEAWVLFDSEKIYVSARVWDSVPSSAWVANEMRRDTSQLRENDVFWAIFDTFLDRRNGIAFYTNPLGALGDFAFTNEGSPNGDWNPVWDVRTGRFLGGWTVEMEIPFKSLRYRPGSEQVWGVQLHRRIRRKNEWVFINPVPISAGRGAVFRSSNFGTLVGLKVPDGSNRLEIKPYAIAGVTTDASASPPTRNAWDGTGGVDVKYGLTQNLTADLTYNTDFAQVEVDEQQVNLTRFGLFFPEKREFFLEGRGIFDFARGGGSSRRASALRSEGGDSSGSYRGGQAPTLFYSRRIGLQGGTILPIVGGGRVTGKAGAFDIGALNMQTNDAAVSGSGQTNFTVMRVKRDVLRRSSVGGLFTNRSVSVVGDGASQTYGTDATFSFYENVSLIAFLARTQTPGLDAKDLSYQGKFAYAGDRYGVEAEHLVVEDHFLPEVGFVRRDNFRRSYGTGRFSPRPRGIAAVRQFRFEGSFDYIETADTGYVETRQTQLGWLTEFENSDRVGLSVADNYELLTEPFEPAPGVVFPMGGYGFRDAELLYAPGTHRRFSGYIRARLGEYFNGAIRSLGVGRARLELTERFSVEPMLSINWIDTPQGTFQTNLIVSRLTYTFTPRMFFGGLVQYNSSTESVSSNLRLRWEYIPGSELFVVYTEEREMDPLRPDRYSGPQNRGFVVKVNRLFRF